MSKPFTCCRHAPSAVSCRAPILLAIGGEHLGKAVAQLDEVRLGRQLLGAKQRINDFRLCLALDTNDVELQETRKSLRTKVAVREPELRS